MNAASKMMSPAECKCLTVSGKIEVLSQCIEFVLAHVTEAGFVSSRQREIELVVEEVVANIYRHGYDDQPGPVEICCRRVDAQRLQQN
jgi:anti-sigma regulatory factor (Ser/Thr protein kinase)